MVREGMAYNDANFLETYSVSRYYNFSPLAVAPVAQLDRASVYGTEG